MGLDCCGTSEIGESKAFHNIISFQSGFPHQLQHRTSTISAAKSEVLLSWSCSFWLVENKECIVHAYDALIVRNLEIVMWLILVRAAKMTPIRASTAISVVLNATVVLSNGLRKALPSSVYHTLKGCMRAKPFIPSRQNTEFPWTVHWVCVRSSFHCLPSCVSA